MYLRNSPIWTLATRINTLPEFPTKKRAPLRRIEPVRIHRVPLTAPSRKTSKAGPRDRKTAGENDEKDDGPPRRPPTLRFNVLANPPSEGCVTASQDGEKGYTHAQPGTREQRRLTDDTNSQVTHYQRAPSLHGHDRLLLYLHTTTDSATHEHD